MFDSELNIVIVSNFISIHFEKSNKYTPLLLNLPYLKTEIIVT